VGQLNFVQGETLGAKLNCVNANTDRRVAKEGCGGCVAIVSGNLKLTDYTIEWREIDVY